MASSAEGELLGARVLVTGASRGLGRAMAVALAAAGAELLITGRDADGLRASVDAVAAVGGTAHPYALDVTDGVAVEQLAERVDAEWGAVDVLVANAGISLVKPSLETSTQEFDRVLTTNVLGTFVCATAFGRRMLRRNRGKIITVSSDLGFRGEPCWAAYAASKAAVINLTKTLAWEWAPSVTVNCLAPGAFATDMNAALLARPGVAEGLVAATPLHRIGRPEEIGRSAVFLAGPGSDFMTGSVLSIDGGIRRS